MNRIRVTLPKLQSKIKCLNGVTILCLDVIGKLRCDADLRYIYTGEPKPRGRKHKYDGKVDLTDVSARTLMGEIEPNLHLHTLIVWSLSLKRKICLAYLLDSRNPSGEYFCSQPISTLTQRIF